MSHLVIHPLVDEFKEKIIDFYQQQLLGRIGRFFDLF